MRGSAKSSTDHGSGRAAPRMLVWLLFALAATGCTDREAQVLFLEFNQAVGQETQCQARPSGGNQAFRAIGWLDIGFRNRYTLFPIVSNNLEDSESTFGQGPQTLRLDNSTVQVTGATVSYDIDPQLEADLAAKGAQIPQGQFVFTSGSVVAGGQSVFALDIVPPLVGELFRLSELLSERYATTQILVRVQIEGVLPDGEVVRSNEFVYPLNLCRGCLVFFPVEDCTVVTEEVDLPCFPGQDEPMDCRVAYQIATTEEEQQLSQPPEAP